MNGSSYIDTTTWVFADALGFLCALDSTVTTDTICPGLLVDNFLIVSHNGCRDSLKLDTFIVNQAIADFDYTCGSFTVTFEADTTNSTQWHWDFGDTTTHTDVDTGFIVSYTFPDYGKYLVTLAVYDSVTGCIDTLEKEIIVLESFNSNIISDDTLCLGDLLYMQDSNYLAELRHWWCSNPDDTVIYDPFDTTGLAIAVLSQPGPQTIFLKAQTLTGCIDTAQKNVFVSQPQPVIHMPDLTRNCIPLDKKLYVSDSTDASNPIVNYIWSTGHTTDTINYTIINSSINTFEVTVTNHFGCIGSTAFNFQPHWVTSAFSLPDNICLPDSFQLNNMSSSSLPNLQYTWVFGDGDSSTVKNPKHSYSQGNVYNVRLYVRNDSLGCVDSLNQFIIANKLEASWGADSTNSTCPPMTTNFTDSSRVLSYSPTGLKWNWHFGDGSTSILEDPSHIYSTPGSYDVTMILSNLVGCTDTLHRDSFILIDGPKGSWHVDDKAGCQPLNTLFSAESNNTVSYTWVFGDGNFQINTSNLPTDSIIHLYSYPGEYYPTLILEDTSGCKVPFLGDTITVRPNPIFGISPDTSICQNELVQFQLNMANPSGNISADWWFQGGSPSHSDRSQPIIQFDSAGVFDIYVAVNMESCVDTILYSNYVDVHAVPIASFAASVSDSCVGFNSLFTDHSTPVEGSLQSWQWNFGNGQTSNSQYPLATSYTAVDSFLATLTVHNSWGCTDTTQQIIYARPYPNAYAGKDTSICLNDSLFLNGQGGQTYSWASSSTIDTPSAAQTFSTPLHTEQYILEVLNEYGCADQDSLKVVVHNLPIIDAGVAQTICNGDTATLTASPNNYTSYEWHTTTSCPNCVQTSVSPILTGSYTIVVQDSNNCYNQDSIIVTVLPTTFPKSNDRSICLNDQIQLPQIAGTAHSWTGAQLSCQQCPNPVASPNNTSLYTLSFDLPNGCPAKDTLLINVFDLSNFSAGRDQDICIGEQANLAPQIPSGIPFEWRSPASLSDSFSLNPTLSTTVSSYAELIIGQDACIQNDYVSIFVHDPSPTTSLDIDVCEGDSTQLQVWTDALQIEWLSTFGFLDSSAQQFSSPSIQIDQSHQYTVVGQHQYCPNDTAYANVTVHPKPIIDLGEDMAVLKTQMVQFTPTTNNNIIDWKWSPANLLDCVDCPNPRYEANQDQTFILQATDDWGCTTNDSIAVGLYPPCYVDLITVPTAFSPNGDGVNDQIHPYSIGNKVDFIKNFRIYNRWGILVFESNSLQEGWNGQYKGLDADIGVYAYYVVYPCPLGGEQVIVTGEFTLIR
ncbi:MAG: PKD domain-containing protein [Aureispira sp.]|nr:PKD domain-containing protein [Aureispira sp.]